MKKKYQEEISKIKKFYKINTLMFGLILVAFASIILPIMIFNTIAISKVVAEVIENSSSSPTIDGIPCGAMESSYFHIHIHLDIFINGGHYTIPALVGITNNCLYWLHTHDESGIIHIESPIKRYFTLGQFFDIWNKKFSNTQIFNNLVNGTYALKVYVNGNKVGDDGSNNYRNIILHAHDEIVIIYGKPPSKIPTKYDFLHRL